MRQYFLFISVLLLGLFPIVANAQDATDRISVENQESDGTRIIIAVAETSSPAWLVIYTDIDNNPDPNNELGRELIKSGVFTNTVVILENPIESDAKLWVVLHVDGGQEGVYEGPEAPDSPVQANGENLQKSFNITKVEPTPTSTPTATPTATDTPEPTATHTATNTPEPTPTSTPTATPTATDTPEPTATHTATNTPEPTPTSTPTATPTATDTPEPTATHTATNTPEPTATPTATNTPEPTPTSTPTATPTATNTPEPTATPIPLPPSTIPTTGAAINQSAMKSIFSVLAVITGLALVTLFEQKRRK